ncbi:MAG: ComEC/Rec2 family competence protein [Prolixibacteraceae bacterium]|nr:ComEC/Rec2 family competence protein [Prolixibacteraceae bacterium]
MKPQANIFEQIPFLRFALSFLSGILLHSLLKPDGNRFLFVLIPLFAATFFFLKKAGKLNPYSYWFSVIFFLLFAALGFTYSHFHNKTLFSNNFPVDTKYTGIILEKAPSTKNRYKYVVNINTALKNGATKKFNEKVLVYVSDSVSNSKLEPGSGITFRAKFYEISTNYNPGEFNYKRFMKRKGIRFQTYLHKEIKTVPNARFSLKTKALKIRSQLLELYREYGISGDEFSVLAALTLGDKHYLDNEIKDSFAASGAMHVLAVSGLHVGIIYLIIVFLFRPLKRIKQIRLIKILIIIGLLWGYAFITGLSPSVLRSCTMFSFIVIGENLKRRSNIYNTLAVSAFVIMLINPNIVFEVGFQLSYMAVFSIVFFQPRLANLLRPKNRLLKYLWELFTVSVAAQLGTSLISIYYFHQFPTYFWLSNFIVIPAAGILLYLAVSFFIFSFLPLIPALIAMVLQFVTGILNGAVGFIESLPASTISGLWISPTTIIICYLILFFFTDFLITHNFRNIIWLLGCMFVLFSLNCNSKINASKRQAIVFYNNYSCSLISIIDGFNHYYFASKNEISPFTQSIIENASGYFRINEAIKLNTNENSKKNLALFHPSLVYNNILILISDEKENRIKEKNVVKDYKEKISIEPEVFKHCKTIRFNDKISTEIASNSGKKTTYNKNEGALMLLFK